MPTPLNTEASRPVTTGGPRLAGGSPGPIRHIDAQYINFADQFRVNEIGPITQILQQVPNSWPETCSISRKVRASIRVGRVVQETTYWNSYFAQTTTKLSGIPAYWLLNANPFIRRLSNRPPGSVSRSSICSWTNIADKRYVGSGGVIADSTPDANKTLFFAGYSRAIYGGVTLGLF
ncbi:MAG: hypothetical protein MRJ92_02795 [Nitrospira sp.]|nr:hypothetical protein [Nitrospira sp.]